MESDSQRSPVRPLERQVLAQLLAEARRRAGLDVATAAVRWGELPARLHNLEAGNDVPDWWQLRSLLMVYGLALPTFVAAFEDRLAALDESPASTASPFLLDPLR